MNYNPEIRFVSVVPVLSTSPAYTAGDVLFDTTLVPVGNIVCGKIKYVTIIDNDDVGEACALYFMKTSATLGTANAVPSISDANAAFMIGLSSTLTAGTDLGGCRVGSLVLDIPFDVQGGSLYMAGVTTTALTHTASGCVFNLSIEKLA